MVDWSDLPSELLVLILKRLNRLDAIRWGSVSKSWFSVQQEYARPLKLPWLLLSDDDRDTKSRGILSVSEQRTDRLFSPKLLGKRCCGSSHGWLFTLDVKYRLSLLHPFTESIIYLPTLPPFHDFMPNPPDDEIILQAYIQKGILSCDPIKSRDECVVMVILGSKRILAYCKVGDKDWKILPRVAAIYIDVIFYKKKFYAVDCRGNTVVCDIGPKRRVKPCVPNCHKGDANHHYLVDFNGDLLHVIRHTSLYEVIWRMGYDNEVMYKRCSFFKGRDLEKRPSGPPPDYDDLDNRIFTYRFDVFKLDPVKQEWEEIESLGDHTLFLGSNYSTCVSASTYPGCKANCIYFTDDCFDRLAGYGFEDNGIYGLESETIHPVISTEFFHQTLSPPIWFLSP